MRQSERDDLPNSCFRRCPHRPRTISPWRLLDGTGSISDARVVKTLVRLAKGPVKTLIGLAWGLVYPPVWIPGAVGVLARSDLSDPQAALKDRYTWKRERGLRFGDGAFKVSALILTPLLAAVLDGRSQVSTCTAVVFLVCAAVFSILGAVWMARAGQIERVYQRQAIAIALVRATPGGG